MFIQEFIQKYCRDILEKQHREIDAFDDIDLEYDYIVTDIDGRPIKVVLIDNLEVPVLDIVTTDKESFLALYKTPSAEEIYDNYLKSIDFISGPEALTRIRTRMAEETARLSKESELMSTCSDLNS